MNDNEDPPVCVRCGEEYSLNEPDMNPTRYCDDCAQIVAEERDAAVDLVRRLVGAMKVWGSWEDGVPDPEYYGEDNVVLGCAFDEAVAFLKERKR